MKYESKLKCLTFFSEHPQVKLWGIRVIDSKTGEHGPTLKVLKQAYREELIDPETLTLTDKARRFLAQRKVRRVVFSVPTEMAKDVQTLVASYVRMATDSEML